MLFADVISSESAMVARARPAPLITTPGSAFETSGSVFACAPGSE